jgi:hypothetical protein
VRLDLFTIYTMLSLNTADIDSQFAEHLVLSCLRAIVGYEGSEDSEAQKLMLDTLPKAALGYRDDIAISAATPSHGHVEFMPSPPFKRWERVPNSERHERGNPKCPMDRCA